MFDDLPSDDGIEEEPKTPAQKETKKDNGQQQLTGWERFWNRITHLGMGDIAMRTGTAMVTISLIGLVVWVMKGNFVGEEMVSGSIDPDLPAAGGPEPGVVALPAYEGVAPVEGLSKSADSRTDTDVVSRYDFVEYEVVSGDTLFDIAETYGITPQSILWTNFDVIQENPAAIFPGQVLSIPPVDGAHKIWFDGDGLNTVSRFYNVTPEAIIEWPGNNLSHETIGDYANPNIEHGTVLFVPGGEKEFWDWTTTVLVRDEAAESNVWGEGKCEPVSVGPVGTGTYIWPADDTIISGYNFSPEINHWGIDVSGDLNDPLYAVDSGVVVYAGWNDWGYGNVIAIDHGNDFQSLYAHLQSLNVGCGSFITKGDVIGFMGSTGNSSGAHLHYELIHKGGRVNPHHYLPY